MSFPVQHKEIKGQNCRAGLKLTFPQVPS